MPVYEYKCSTCGHRFEVKTRFYEQPQVSCPCCRGEARRIYNPVPIIFKGPGFYITDSRQGGRGEEKEKEE